MKRKKKPATPDFEAFYKQLAADHETLSAQLRKERARNRALGEAVNTAEAMLYANDRDSAQLVLTAARRLYINGMRDTVSNDAGGNTWVARRSEGTYEVTFGGPWRATQQAGNK